VYGGDLFVYLRQLLPPVVGVYWVLFEASVSWGQPSCKLCELIARPSDLPNALKGVDVGFFAAPY
jgi:hypothetical protein